MYFATSIVARYRLVCGVAIAALLAAGSQASADGPLLNQSGSGLFVSYNGKLLILKGKSGHLTYDSVGENYKTYQNNEEGPGSRLVPTAQALTGEKLPGKITPLTRVLPGTRMRVDVDKKEIHFGYDFRVIGNFVSYQEGKLNLQPAAVEPGLVKVPDGNIGLAIDPKVPVVESIQGADLKFVGSAGEVLKRVEKGAVITAHSHYDPAIIESIEIGEPKRRMERYIGQTRGSVRGPLVSFTATPKGDILRIQAKGIGPSAADEYEQLVVRRIDPALPIFESVDGAPYRPATLDALRSAKEGTIITLTKVEDILLEVRIGVAK